MKHYVSQDLPSVLMVSTKLWAAEIVVPSVNSVNAFASGSFFEPRHKFLGDAVYTSNGGHNPYFISDSYFAILSYISFETLILVFYGQRFVDRIVWISKSAGKIGLQIILVNPLSGL